MIIALHFDAQKHGTLYGLRIQQLFFRSLLSCFKGETHLKILAGNLLVHHFAGEKWEDLLRGLLGYELRIWRAVDPEEFAHALGSTGVYVIAVEGMTWNLRDSLHLGFKKDDSYLGSLEVNPTNPVHWGLYQALLIPKFRFVNGQLRIFYREFEGDDSKHVGLMKDWSELEFSSIVWEDLGVRHTIFDAFDSHDHAKRFAELSDGLSLHLARLAEEVLLRIADSDLREKLHGAFTKFDFVETAEDVAKVALSCRRFLVGLADMLFPPRDALFKNRKVGKEEYRNRLWAYAEDRLAGDEKQLVLIELQDLGHRIDKLDRLANKGLHDKISRSDLHRLLVSLLTLTYDLFSLAPPALNAPLEPHGDQLNKAFKAIHDFHSKKKEENEN